MRLFSNNPVNHSQFFIRQLFFLSPLFLMLGGVICFLDGRSQIVVFSAIREGYPTLTRALILYTHYGNYLMYIVYVGLLLHAFRTGREDFKWWVAYYVVVQLVVALITVQLLKSSFGRARPDTGEDAWHFFSTKGKYHSFPSGHTTEITSASGPFAQLGRNFLTAACWGIIPALMGFSRIYLGRHFPLDVFGGALVGSVGAYLIVFLYLCKKQSLTPPAL